MWQNLVWPVAMLVLALGGVWALYTLMDEQEEEKD